MKSHEEKSRNEEMHEEDNNPLDEWSVKNTLLALIPFIVGYAFKDVGLKAATNFGIAFAGFGLMSRLFLFQPKMVWPIIEIATVTPLVILRGLALHYGYWLYKWFPIITPLIFIIVSIISICWRRPWVAHYARYPATDASGRHVWETDANYRRACDVATVGWTVAWSIMLLLSLAPILTGNWYQWGALNIIFNYVTIYVLFFLALQFQVGVGKWYFNKSKHSTSSVYGDEHPARPPATSDYPAGPVTGADAVPVPDGPPGLIHPHGQPYHHHGAAAAV